MDKSACLAELAAARKVLTDHIANMNWNYRGRDEVIEKIGKEVTKIDELILKIAGEKPCSG